MIEDTNGSFLEDIPQHILDAEILDISERLFDDWMNNNLDDGQFWADYRFAELSNDKTIKNKFNNHWNIKKGEEYYL